MSHLPSRIQVQYRQMDLEEGELGLKRAREDLISRIPHSFYVADFLGPSICDHCSGFIWGLAGQGFRCHCCNFAAHFRCVQHVLPNCSLNSPLGKKIGESAQTGHATVDAMNNIHFPHKWTESELKFSATCSVCEGYILLDEVIGSECSRCRTIVHSSCVAKVPPACHPIHKDLILVPEIDTITTNPIRSPLIVFVNSRSGGKEGADLIEQFSSKLGDDQVFDLDICGGPEPPLQRMKDIHGLRILVCGGDGTVGWVMSFLDKIPFKTPPSIAILPLGTGNDLARTIGWGSGYSSESLDLWLINVAQATPVPFDVWLVKVRSSPEAPIPSEEKTDADFIMNNYTSFGADAKVVLDFHNFRKKNPELHFSQWVNKFWYGAWGGLSIVCDTIPCLDEYMTIETDGVAISIPEAAEGLIIMNVPFYAGGAEIWGLDEDSIHSRPTVYDSKLELVVVTGGFHMAMSTFDLTPAIRLAQGNNINLRIRTKNPIPFHVDGEPLLLQCSCDIQISLKSQVQMLTHKPHRSAIPT